MYMIVVDKYGWHKIDYKAGYVSWGLRMKCFECQNEACALYLIKQTEDIRDF